MLVIDQSPHLRTAQRDFIEYFARRIEIKASLRVEETSAQTREEGGIWTIRITLLIVAGLCDSLCDEIDGTDVQSLSQQQRTSQKEGVRSQ